MSDRKITQEYVVSTVYAVLATYRNRTDANAAMRAERLVNPHVAVSVTTVQANR